MNDSEESVVAQVTTCSIASVPSASVGIASGPSDTKRALTYGVLRTP